MLRSRPRRFAPRWLRHPATGWLFLSALYLAATVINALLAISMSAVWPALIALVLAMIAGVCATTGIRTMR
jgi:hypothetical protein